MASSERRPLVLFGRAVLLQCPNCGGGPLFSRWLRMRERCPVCGIRLARGEEGYQVGAYMFNMIAAELIFAGIFLAILVYTWPHPPWTPLLYGGIALMIVLPALFYPFSKTLFLAFDLVFRPPTATDFE
ncbi:MAG TPA: DUF983 domain-containing protein [Gemmatimonadales bacterium]|nr:DUF983 domain-containing protein [Gemmatimonadales bacterium]